MKSLHSEITIDAPPEVVWGILMDFAAYPEWNPFIVRGAGEPALGNELEMALRTGKKPMVFTPTVTEYVEAGVLEWLGRLWVRGLFDGRHRFELHPVDGGTRFVQTERFTGIVAPVLFRAIATKTNAAFEAMNRALRDRAETTAETTS